VCEKQYSIGKKGESAIVQHIGCGSHQAKKEEKNLAMMRPDPEVEWEQYESLGITQVDEPHRYRCSTCRREFPLIDDNSIVEHLNSDRHLLLAGRQRNELMEEYRGQGIREEGTDSFFCEHCRTSIKFSECGRRYTVERHIFSQAHLLSANSVEDLTHDVAFMDLNRLDPTAAWNRRKLTLACMDERAAISWCMEQGILPTRRQCEKGHEMVLSERGDGVGLPRFRCRKSGCVETVTIAVGTLFEDDRLSVMSAIRYNVREKVHVP
jgi:hypothetical protein